MSMEEGTSIQTESETIPTEAPDMQSQPLKKQKVSKQGYQKGIWLITYASGSPDITVEMLHSNNVQCDENYTITWRESKYTLLHFNQKHKIRQSALIKTMNILREKFGVIESSVVGYESLSCNNDDEKTIQDHPGFKRMIEILNSNKEEMKVWIEGGDLMSYRKGLLWKFIQVENPKNMTRTQLLMKVSEWTPIIEDSKELKSQNELLQMTLSDRNEKIESLYKELIKKNRTISQLKYKLEQAGLDSFCDES